MIPAGEMADVEMMDVSELAEQMEATVGGLAEQRRTYIALDTNIFISELATVQGIYQRLCSQASAYQHRLITSQHTLPSAGPAPAISLLVPNVVIRELDRQKNLNQLSPPHARSHAPGERTNVSIHDPKNLDGAAAYRLSDLGVRARAATSWLLDVGRGARLVGGGGDRAAGLLRLQRMGECTEYGKQLHKADDRILDCCIHFTQQDHRVLLWTNDKNLALQAEVHSIPTLGNENLSAPTVLCRVLQMISRGSFRPEDLEAIGLGSKTKHDRDGQPTTAMTDAVETEDVDMALDDDEVAIKAPSVIKAIPQTDRAHRAKPLQTLNSTGRAKSEPKVGEGKIPTFRILTPALSTIISIPVYALLLDTVGGSDPITLRRLLGRHDPGPGHWTFKHTLDLMTRFWETDDDGGRVGIGVIWAEEAVSPRSDAASLAKREEGSEASAFAPKWTIDKRQTAPSRRMDETRKGPTDLSPGEIARIEEARGALVAITIWYDHYSSREECLDLEPILSTAEEKNVDPARTRAVPDENEDMSMDDDDTDEYQNGVERHEMEVRRTMGRDWALVAGLLEKLLLEPRARVGKKWWLESKDRAELENILKIIRP